MVPTMIAVGGKRESNESGANAGEIKGSVLKKKNPIFLVNINSTHDDDHGLFL
jgi:hypothetical protein